MTGLRCEGCGSPATTWDTDGVALCSACGDASAREWVALRRSEGLCALFDQRAEPCERPYGHRGPHSSVLREVS